MPVNIGITLIIKLAFIYVLQTEGLYPPKIHMVETDAQCDGILIWDFGRQLSQGSGAPWMGSLALQKGLLSAPSPPHQMLIQQTSGPWEPGSRPSADTEQTGTRILDFPASRSVRNASLLFTSRPAYGDLVQQPEQTMTVWCVEWNHPRGSFSNALFCANHTTHTLLQLIWHISSCLYKDKALFIFIILETNNICPYFLECLNDTITALRGLTTDIRSKDSHNWPHNVSSHTVIQQEIESNLVLNLH